MFKVFWVVRLSKIPVQLCETISLKPSDTTAIQSWEFSLLIKFDAMNNKAVSSVQAGLDTLWCFEKLHLLALHVFKEAFVTLHSHQQRWLYIISFQKELVFAIKDEWSPYYGYAT